MMIMGKAFRGGRFVAFFKPRAALLGVALLAALAMGLCLAQPAWADEDSSDETYNVTVTGVYHQADAYSMLAMINKFRTAEVDENDGNTPWAWNETDTKKVHYDGLKELKWSSDLEEIAMQRAAEIALYYEHERPNGEEPLTAQSANGARAFGENIALGGDSEGCAALGIEASSFTAEKAFKGWREDNYFYSSPYYGQGHRRIMLGNYTSIGISCFELNGVRYWALEVSGETQANTAAMIEKTVSVNLDVKVSNLPSFTIPSLKWSTTIGKSLKLPASVGCKLNESIDGYEHQATFTAQTNGAWKIESGSDVVSLKDGEVTALKPGTATLTNMALGKKATYTITVTNKNSPSITGFDDAKVAKLSDSLTFSPKCDSDAKPSFKSSDTSVATVDGNGKVTLKKIGYADITVSYAETDDYEAVSKTCKLTVVDDATNVPADGKGEVQIYIPGQNNANVTVTPAATVSAPAKTSISKLVKAKKAFTVKWKKKSGVTGYQVRYSLKSSMKGSKTVKVKSAKTVSKKVKKLKKKKRYYVQVRTYKVVNGKTYWSGWSAKKSVKTK